MQHKMLGTLIGLALVFPAMSMAGDKTQSTLVNRLVPPAGAVPAVPNPSGPFWTNGISKGKSKGDDKCKVQIQMKGIALPDTDQVPCSGDEVICVAHSHTTVLGVPTDGEVVGELEPDADRGEPRAPEGDEEPDGDDEPARRGGPAWRDALLRHADSSLKPCRHDG